MQSLKDKAKDQENKLNNDERIVKMEKQLEWYKNEFFSLLKLKDKNENHKSEMMHTIRDLQKEKEDKQDQIKA